MGDRAKDRLGALVEEHQARLGQLAFVRHLLPEPLKVGRREHRAKHEVGRLGRTVPEENLDLVLNEAQIDDDISIVAGDNLFSHSLAAFGDYCRERRAPVLAVYDVGDLEEIKKYNAIEIDADDRITFFEEKPAQPKSTLDRKSVV